MSIWQFFFWLIGWVIAVVTVAWDALPADWHPTVKVLVLIFGTVAAARIIGLVIGVPRQFLSGVLLRMRSPYGKAAWARFADVAGAGMLKIGGLFLGQWRGWFRNADLFRHGEGHLLTIAAPGAGKTTGLVIPALLTVQHGAVIVTDPKAQLAAMTARHRRAHGEVFFLNPFGEDLKESAGIDLPDSGFNPLSILKDGINLVDDARGLARLLMVTDRRESGSYWNDESAALLAALIVWIIRKEPPELRTLTFLWSIVREGPEAMEQRLEWMAGERDPYMRAEGERLLGLFSVKPQWQGVISKAQVVTDRYAPGTPLGIHTAKDGLDLRRLKREDITIYLLIPTGRAKVAAPWLNMLMGVFGIAIAKPGPARPVYMLMDEAPALGYLPDLRNNLREGREAGLRAWIFTQTRAAMADPDLYGDTGFRDIMGLCETKTFFAIGERDLAQEISDMVGQRTATNRTMRDDGNRENVSTVGVPLLRPEDILRLPAGQMVVLRNSVTQPIRARLVPYWTRAAWQSAVDANPYRDKAKA